MEHKQKVKKRNKIGSQKRELSFYENSQMFV